MPDWECGSAPADVVGHLWFKGACAYCGRAEFGSTDAGEG